VLMENAGRGVVDKLLQLDPELGSTEDSTDRSVAVLCGKGNNAGDGFVIARHLGIRGVGAQVILLCSPAELEGDAKTNFDLLEGCTAQVFDLSRDVSGEDSAYGALVERLDEHAAGAAWLVDAMLGTGAAGEPRDPLGVAITWMNRQPSSRLAVDIPSGLDCDTGKPAHCTVRANHTCTFVAVKSGFLAPTAQQYLGEVSVVSIGAPQRVLDQAATES
ncbi:MAG: NAD(P)H-hydrate epimerase, partial [Planctomycetota bacterium]